MYLLQIQEEGKTKKENVILIFKVECRNNIKFNEQKLLEDIKEMLDTIKHSFKVQIYFLKENPLLKEKIIKVCSSNSFFKYCI